MRIKTFIILGFVAALSGCGLLKPVPTTKISGEFNGHKWSYTNPKQACVTNLSIIVNTNGEAKFEIGSISSVNDPQVIDKAYAGQAAVINQLSAATHQAITDAIAAAKK